MNMNTNRVLVSAILLCAFPLTAVAEDDVTPGTTTSDAATGSDTNTGTGTSGGNQNLGQPAPGAPQNGEIAGVDSGSSEPGPARSEAPSPATQTGTTTKKGKQKPLTFDLSYTHLYDSNINQDKDDPDAVNANVIGLRINYRQSWGEASYEVGRHFYPEVAGDRDRLSQNFRIAGERPLSKRLTLETVGEISLKGSTEDRDLSNQYVFSPRLEYRLNSANRVRLITAYRIRRYPDDAERNALNRYVALEYQRRFEGGRRLEFGYRFETNRARGARNDYRRQTFSADYILPLSPRDRLSFDATYRPRRYISRRLDNGDLRRDRNIILGASYLRTLRSDLDFLLGYRFEKRNSNDPRRGFNEHTVAGTVTYHF
jgi:hypothetical protein